MEAVFHSTQDSGQYWREFADKRAGFVLRELRDVHADDLKAILRTMKEENRTVEQKAG